MRPSVDLPQPLSPTSADRLAAGDAEADLVDGRTGAAEEEPPGREIARQALRLKAGRSCDLRALGLSSGSSVCAGRTGLLHSGGGTRAAAAA